MKFAEQFKEVKEAARLAREKSQERFELANPGLNIAAPQVKVFLFLWLIRAKIDALHSVYSKELKSFPQKSIKVAPLC